MKLDYNILVGKEVVSTDIYGYTTWVQYHGGDHAKTVGKYTVDGTKISTVLLLLPHGKDNFECMVFANGKYYREELECHRSPSYYAIVKVHKLTVDIYILQLPWYKRWYYWLDARISNYGIVPR